MPIRFLNIALSGPLYQLFDYLPPTNRTIANCAIGARVRVPFGRGTKVGLIIGYSADSAIVESKIRRVSVVLDDQPLLQATDLAFLRWVANYYHHPLGDVVLAALPLRLRKHEQALSLQVSIYRLVLDVPDALAATQRAPRQQALVRTLAEAKSATCCAETLRRQFSQASEVLKRLVEKGVVAIEQQAPEANQLSWKDTALVLNSQQLVAIQAVEAELSHFKTFLLDGITGSGKTEVYLRLCKKVLEQGKNVLLLVPEISLTPQLAEGFRARLGDCVAVMHSGLTDSERELSWHRARLGLSRVMLGTRSLIFYPIAKLGLVIVDEEHDPSFKQYEGLRYSARDLAIIRAQRAKCPVILGSATPALESFHNAKRGRYTHLKLTQRAGNAQPPQMHIVDIRDQPLQAGIAQPLLAAIQTTLHNHQQAMVFINRRGYAPVLSCFDCHWVSACDHCDANQTVHRAVNMLRCHHCGAQRRIPSVCPECGSTELHPLGQGTEKVEDFLQVQFPDVPLLRVDRDTTARKNSLKQLLQKIQQVDAALLVGTQMLAKGHHFPKVTLVCVLDADSGLFSADFRATERMAQLLLQVAGRAGRGDKAGQVLIQSRFPDHPLLQIMVNEGYTAFAQAALVERLEANYPPFSYQVLIRAEAKQAEQATAFLANAVDWIKQQGHSSVSIWGPVPAPMVRKVGKYRSHLLLQAAQREPLHHLMHPLRLYLSSQPMQSGLRWSLDVDPYDGY